MPEHGKGIGHRSSGLETIFAADRTCYTRLASPHLAWKGAEMARILSITFLAIALGVGTGHSQGRAANTNT